MTVAVPFVGGVIESQASTLNALRFDVACEMTERWYHPKHGTGPAVWVVWWRKCCDKVKPFVLACDGCTRYIRDTLSPGACAECGTKYVRLREAVVHVEPLGWGGVPRG